MPGRVSSRRSSLSALRPSGHPHRSVKQTTSPGYPPGLVQTQMGTAMPKVPHSADTPGTLHTAALKYAARGWPVFPCVPGGKAPLTEHGFHDASTDVELVRYW